MKAVMKIFTNDPQLYIKMKIKHLVVTIWRAYRDRCYVIEKGVVLTKETHFSKLLLWYS